MDSRVKNTPTDGRPRTRFAIANSLPTAMALSLSAGYLDGFTYIGHGHVFASAMTGNMVLLGLKIATLSSETFAYAFPIVAYVVGVLIAHTLMRESIRKHLPLAPHSLTLLLEILVLLAVAYAPIRFEDSVLISIITISTSMQNTSFRNIGERTYNSVIMTGNLQNFSNALASGARPWTPARLREARDLGGVLLSFLVGAALGALMTPRFGNHAVVGPALLLTLGVGVLLATGSAGRLRTNRYYRGPPSDHFDGTHFFIAGGAPDKTRADLFRLIRTPFAAWPREVANPAPAPVSPRVEGGALRVTSIGHATHLVQTRGLNILIDPVWSDRASPFRFAGPKRVSAPGVTLDALPALDAILITHNHYDHLDLATLERLMSTTTARPRLIVPLGNDTIIRNRVPGLPVEAHDWGDRVVLSPDVAVTLAPSYHWSARGVGDRRMALWAAFVLETPDGAILHIGDTAYRDNGLIFRAMADRFGAPRLAIIPIGAYEPRWFMRDQHVDPAESVEIFKDCRAHHALAHHWGSFRLTAEPREEPPARLAAALADAGIAASRFRVQRPGEAFDVPPIPPTA